MASPFEEWSRPLRASEEVVGDRVPGNLSAEQALHLISNGLDRQLLPARQSSDDRAADAAKGPPAVRPAASSGSPSLSDFATIVTYERLEEVPIEV